MGRFGFEHWDVGLGFQTLECPFEQCATHFSLSDSWWLWVNTCVHHP